jgi:CheY-like chemotaxis protein
LRLGASAQHAGRPTRVWAVASILLIDDDEGVRLSVAAALRHAGHSVVPARNGREALVFFDSGSFDLVITDIIMPEMEGIETIMQLRKAGGSIPILAISGDGRRCEAGSYLDLAGKLGADAALNKPFSAVQLRVAVARLTGVEAEPRRALPFGWRL